MKNKFTLAGLYSGFFAVSFALCLFLTFDARILGSLLEQQARKVNLKLSFEQAKMSGLFGLELLGVEIAPLNRPEAKPFGLRRLKLSPGLSSLPGMLWDLRKKRPPRVALGFSAWLADTGQRNLGGDVKFGPKAMTANLDAANLPVDRLPTGLVRNFPPLSGKLNGKLRLDLKDRQKPSTWDCLLKLDLFQAQLGELNVSGMKVPGFNLGNANLELDLQNGKGPLKSLRLQEGDLLVDLNGAIALPESGPMNFGAINVQLNGTLNMTEENKQKLLALSTIIPPGGRLNYSGEIRALSPMLSSPGGNPNPNPNPEPNPEPDPLADPLSVP